MKAIVAAEHFGLTPAMREHAEAQIQKLEAFLPSDAVLRIFLSTCTKGEFTVLLRAHWRNEELISKMQGPDLYVAIGQAMTTLKNRFQKQKQRSIARRRNDERAGWEHDRSA